MNHIEPDNLARLEKPRPRVIPASEHSLPSARVSSNAIKVLRRLRGAGYQSFLVGGCVRDLLLNQRPKDFDVVTDAHPEQVRELFRNCILIGRRFRLAHVRFGPEIIEVSTFRAPHQLGAGGMLQEGRIIRDNVYGDREDDAWRRDFTINALFYDAEDGSLVDYTGGFDDLRRRNLRLIGEPLQRYREDPLRMLRAIRFAARLGFEIAPASAVPIKRFAAWLDKIPPARLFDEFIKLFLSGHAAKTWRLLRTHQLAGRLFPKTEALLREDPEGPGARMADLVMEDTDRRVAAELPVTPAFLIAALLWPDLRAEMEGSKPKGKQRARGEDEGEPDPEHLAAGAVLARQVTHLAIPRRFSLVVREIWQLQRPLQRYADGARRRVEDLRCRVRFRAAYDFLLLRARAGESVQREAGWWTELQEREPRPARAPANTRGPTPRHRRRRRKR